MFFPGFFYFDPLYLVFALPALLLALYAQFQVRSAYETYSQVRNLRGLTGEQAAQYLLAAGGLNGVSLEGTPGDLSDHYDPREKVLRLSPGVARSASVAALGIVAHEVGHALQDRQGYLPLRLRAGLVPAVTAGAWLGPLLFFAGFLLGIKSLAWLGVLGFAAAAVFALVTLPVELNASQRALQLLTNTGLVVGTDEADGARRVLNAAALTYVAALAQALSTLLYYVFLLSGMRREE